MMKKHKINILIRSVLILFAFFLFITSYAIPGTDQTNPEEDTLNAVSYAGTITSEESGDPVVFANVFVEGTSLGTVTNTEGKFLIKIPEKYLDKRLGVSSVGFEVRMIPISELSFEENEIVLEVNPFTLEELIVKNPDPVELIREAKINAPENYGTEPYMMTGFYRETIKKNWWYVSITEAVLDIYKSGYKYGFGSDRTKIFKGRKSQDVERMDTILFKFQGGPYYSLYLDIIKNPGDLLAEDAIDYYDYSMGGFTIIQERQAYIVEFDIKDGVDLPLYKGKIYIDILSKAILGADFKISPKNIDLASHYLIQKKPLLMRASVEKADYTVKYLLVDSLWTLSYVRSDIHFKINWKRKLFNSNYYVVSEMAITDIDRSEVNKIPFRESLRSRDVISEKVTGFTDPDFWGSYNIIRPEDTIEDAVRKLLRRNR